MVLLGLAFAGRCAIAAPVVEDLESPDWQRDGAGFEALEDPARELFMLPQPWSALSATSGGYEELLDTVLTLNHDVPIAEGETLRVHEFFTLRSWLRWPKRAVLFLTTTSVTASLWTIPVEEYNGPEMAAKRGMFAFTADYIGVGANYSPGGDALESTFERNLAALKTVVRYIRYFRAVPKVDIVGESWGGAFATQLAADPGRIRSCVMASMTYKEVGNPMLVSPQFVAFLKTLEHNYLPADAAMIEQMAVGAPEEVLAYIRETQTGPRLTTQLWQMIAGLPHFDAGVARVPGLVISNSAESADGRALAVDYGTDGAAYFEIENSPHAPRLAAESVGVFWHQVFDFIDSHSQNARVPVP